MVNSYDAKTHSRSYATTVSFQSGALILQPLNMRICQAFYEPNKDRPNLVVLPLALGARVLTEPGTKGDVRATGVEFIHNNSAYVVHAKREVILSAG